MNKRVRQFAHRNPSLRRIGKGAEIGSVFVVDLLRMQTNAQRQEQESAKFPTKQVFLSYTYTFSLSNLPPTSLLHRI